MEFYWKTNSRSHENKNESQTKVGVNTQGQSKESCQITKEGIVEAEKNALEIQ